MIDGDELERSYKHHLSDYSEWGQRDHASNWMLIEDNLGENLSIDETMLQEDLVTILSNKDGHCKQGSVISIVRGTKAEDVIEVLMQIPEEARLAVKEVTMDLSSSMRAIVSAVFPNATIVLDCFHVLKRCTMPLRKSGFISNGMPRLNYADRSASTGRHRSVARRIAGDIGRSIPENREL
jgi:Transposase and inactivated derivatives